MHACILNVQNLHKTRAHCSSYNQLLERLMHTPLETVITNAAPRTTKLRAPLISLKRQTPHIDATKPGPLVMMGKLVAKPRASFAMNQQLCAVAHIIPDAKAGKIA